VMLAVAPVLRGVLRHYVALERERFVNYHTSQATHRLRFGWLALDAVGQVLDWDAEGLRIMEESEILSRSASGQLIATPNHLQREIARVLKRIADNPRGRAYAITLRRDPWLDMLLVPTTRRSISAGPSPVVISYIHGDSWHAADCCEQLAELFALTPSEAKLALAVCRGMTIAEAATELGISVGTARSYSKSIYGKTGARGLPDLVRIVMRSVLAIAQEH
jgi:DNA-binding CsgD family transcriptional regulator